MQKALILHKTFQISRFVLQGCCSQHFCLSRLWFTAVFFWCQNDATKLRLTVPPITMVKLTNHRSSLAWIG